MNFVLVEAHVGHITSWFFQTYTEAHRYMMKLLKQTLDTCYSDEEIPYWEEIILWEQYNGGFFGFSGDCAYADTGCYTHEWQIFSVHQEEHGCPLIKKVEK